MALKSGARLGPYEILSAIGAGGMGEVYRAHDARLGRDVAIKVLPAAFSTDPERLQRFEQEARAAAALNHPNILAVHDIGQRDGAPYIVSELLEGETLRERLSGGALPVRKAVEYAVQICQGLAAAHEKGIIHRDLKPENVFVRSDGRVKILDFGLAKLTHADPAHVGASELPTIAADTLPGVVLGTVGYMSPEQVRGVPADHRSDIFAFGAVLYEMLSGQRAFRGDTAMDLMTAILKEDPPGMPVADRHIPPTLGRIVERCLEKSPAARFQSTRDLAFALEASAAHSGATESVVTVRPRSRERLAWVALTTALVAVLLLFTVVNFRRTPNAQQIRFLVNTPATPDPLSLAISPDGTRVAFVATSADEVLLWLRPLHSLAAQPLAGTDGAKYPFWSPDSQSIGFFAEGKLKRIDLGGGPPRALCDAPSASSPLGGTWNRNGVILFAANRRLHRVPAEGGTPTELESPDTSSVVDRRWPYFLPDGEHFLYYTYTLSERPENNGIYLGSLKSQEHHRLVTADTNAIYSPPGYLLFMRQGTLTAQRFDLSTLETKGEAFPVADEVARDFDASDHIGAFSVSATGALSYRGGDEFGGSRQLVWFDRSGREAGRIGSPAAILNPELSRDEKRIAFDLTTGGKRNVWLMGGVRGEATRFTFDGALDLFPVWSPEGDRIVFGSNRTGFYDLYQQVFGAASEELLLQSSEHKGPQDWSADGRFILYGTGGRNSSIDIWTLPTGGDLKPFPFANTRFNEREGQFSPDGKWVAYQSDESGRYEVYVRAFPPVGEKWPISSAGGFWPRWRHDGKELFYMSAEAKLMSVAITVDPRRTSVETASGTELFQTSLPRNFSRTGQKQQYVVSSDGQRFLFNVPIGETASPITVVLNWTAALKE